MLFFVSNKHSLFHKILVLTLLIVILYHVYCIISTENNPTNNVIIAVYIVLLQIMNIAFEYL